VGKQSCLWVGCDSSGFFARNPHRESNPAPRERLMPCSSTVIEGPPGLYNMRFLRNIYSIYISFFETSNRSTWGVSKSIGRTVSCGRLEKKGERRRHKQNGTVFFCHRVVDWRRKENDSDTNRMEQASSVFVRSAKKKGECRRFEQNGTGLFRFRMVGEEERRMPTIRIAWNGPHPSSCGR